MLSLHQMRYLDESAHLQVEKGRSFGFTENSTSHDFQCLQLAARYGVAATTANFYEAFTHSR